MTGSHKWKSKPNLRSIVLTRVGEVIRDPQAAGVTNATSTAPFIANQFAATETLQPLGNHAVAMFVSISISLVIIFINVKNAARPQESLYNST